VLLCSDPSSPSPSLSTLPDLSRLFSLVCSLARCVSCARLLRLFPEQRNADLVGARFRAETGRDRKGTIRISFIYTDSVGECCTLHVAKYMSRVHAAKLM